MRKVTLFLSLLVFCACFSFGQNNVIGPVVKYPIYFDVSPPLRDMVKNAPKKADNSWKDGIVQNRYKAKPPANGQEPGGFADPGLQRMNGMVITDTTIVNFDGTGNNEGFVPPDTHGDVGPNHYFQVVNCHFSIYSKTGTLIMGNVLSSTIWNGMSNNYNDGDAVVLYDEQADRWLFSQFSLGSSGNGPYYQNIAVSQTGDPTGSWYRYQYQFTYMPDYPKFGVWPDGYYMSAHLFTTTSFYGCAAVAYDRTKMLSGNTGATMQMFTTSSSNEAYGWLPSDCDGPFPTGNPPNYFVYPYYGNPAHLGIWEFHVDWTTPGNSTLSNFTTLTVNACTDNIYGIAQPGTTQVLDPLNDRMMYRLQYRSFAGYSTLVCNHTVDISSSVAGIRWYELRKTSGAWLVYQQGTYAPADNNSRWMGSIAMDSSGNMALGYSVSSASLYPSIRYTGRRKNDALNTMTIAERGIVIGGGSQTYTSSGRPSRWGDYSSMTCDPSAKATYWYTQEYYSTSSQSSWKTRIASFHFANTPIVATLAATGVTGTGGILNGTVNPNGLATTYHFEWGTSTSYGNNTTTQSAGSGSSDVPVSASLTGLTTGVTYHYRIDATNSDGTSNGVDMTFTPGMAMVTTTAATAITMTTATAGGNVTTDGGSSVTARGTCWSTTANPTIAGSHTTDGSGTGVFTSSLTGLAANTTYHIRAYATNVNGTVYGSDLTFTTLCGIYSLPFSESFSATTIPSCWSQVDHQGNGEIWQFGVITGQTPLPALTGNYAYLNSRGYGSGNSQNADLITPTIDMTGFTNVTLQFNHFFRSSGSSSGTVSYSIDNGSTWTVIQTFTTTTSNPAAFSQVLTALAGQSQVKIKWNYTGTYARYWAIDDVSLTGTSGGPYLTVTPANQNVPATPAGSTSFTVLSNVSWTVASDQTWCTVTPSGTGNGTITANYTVNTSVNSRVANVTTTVTGLSPVIVTVTQAGAAPTLTVTPPNQNVPATPAGSTSFTVTSNTSWTVASDQTWCTVTPSGTGNGTITANYTVNTSVNSRVANVTTTVTGLSPVIVTVTQAGAAPTLTVTPPNQNVPATPAGSTSFTVTSNTSWTVASDQTWCTVTPSGTGNGTITANYTVNTSVNSRVANVTTTVTGLSPVIVTVTQAGAAPTLTVTPPNQDVPATPAGSTSFTVTSNASWTVASDQTWCTVTPSGTGNGTITANYTVNTSVNSRVANITTTVTGLSPVIVTVTQAGAAPTLTVTPPNQNVPATPAGSTSFSVTSNSSWTVISDQTWCTVTPSGTGDGTITANYTENTNTSPRIATITVTVSGIPSVSVTVTQAGTAPSLTVSPSNQDVPATPAGTTYFTVTTTSSSWTAVSNQTWCSVTPSGSGNGTIAAAYTENTSIVIRIATITVSAPGLPSQTATVTQAGAAPTLTVIPPTRNVTAPAGSTDFTVTSNSSWTVTSDQTWCTPTPSGIGNGTLVADYQENTSTSIRTANITVTVSGITPVAVAVIQDGVVGIADHQGGSIRIIPNPATGMFRIVPGNSGRIGQIDILDLTGRIILSRKCTNDNDYQFDFSNAAQGCYFVKVKLNDETLVRRLIISK